MLEINKIYKVNSTAVMQTHANPSQGGQTSVVAHHRAFSQPTVVGTSNLVSTNDPWCLQSTGHQMAPTAPLRVNKRPAPQPVNNPINTASAISKEVDGSVSNLQMQQSHAHSMVPTTSLHVHNVNQIHGSHAASHLTPHGSSSETITTVTNNANNLVMNNQQQQQQMLTFCPQGAVSGVQVNNVAHVSKTANNLMAASLTLHERGLPLKSTTLGSGMQQTGSSQTILQQQQSLPIAASLCSSTMSTSLHSFDKNCTSSNPSTVSTWGVSANPSSASTPNMPCLTNQLPHSSLHNSKAANVSHRKCDVQLNAMPWFHGSITRDEAEHLLNPREDGLFLVRESTNFPGDYTLCVCFQGKVEHYRVKYLENQLTIDDEEYFENLWQLVAHYEADADGLCTQLIKCLPKAGAQQFCLNSKDFIDKGWVIPEADLQLRESIGKGEFGDVMLGILRSEKVAVKMLKDEGAVQKFLAEASVMTTLEHENLVKFIGLVFTSKHIYLVTEYMSKGSLVDYLRSRGRQHITKKDQINFAYDTASGMEYLEAKKVVHRDLAARNVLISEECVAKVSDFGLARGECYNLDVGKLPIKWTAPEALKNGRFSNKSDMWSFGILLWEIYSFGRVPYPRIPLNDVVKHVEVGYKMEAPEGCPAEIYEMMRQAWDLNPLKRPSFAELKIKLLHLKNSTS